MTPPVALTIAGSDSAAGAGIQADLKTFAALDVFGASAITALTAQNTVSVNGLHRVPPDFVDAQIEAVLGDLRVRAVKTGLLPTASIIRTVAARAGRGELPNLVVDPVTVAASGTRLLDADAERAYLEQLFKHALVITPNLREAAALLDRPVTTINEMVGAARALAETGASIVVVKGGHLTDDDAVDVVYTDGTARELRAPRVRTDNVHGTGCTFASAIAAGLARGEEPLRASHRVGQGLRHRGTPRRGGLASGLRIRSPRPLRPPQRRGTGRAPTGARARHRAERASRADRST